MTFKPENKLEESLIRAATDPAYRPQFYRDFVSANIFIIPHGPAPETSGWIKTKESQKIQLANIEHNGKRYIPIFSSLTQLQAFIEGEVGYMALNALEFIKMTQGTELILNPVSELGKEFTNAEIESIIDGSIWKTSETYEAKKDTTVIIGQPANYPGEFVAALVRLFKINKEVKRAYLAHYQNPEIDEKPHTLIAIDVKGDWERIVADAGMIAKDVSVPEPPVDFIRLTGKGGLDGYFLNECKPFYERKLFGIF